MCLALSLAFEDSRRRVELRRRKGLRSLAYAGTILTIFAWTV
jgi:hypothetical protein